MFLLVAISRMKYVRLSPRLENRNILCIWTQEKTGKKAILEALREQKNQQHQMVSSVIFAVWKHCSAIKAEWQRHSITHRHSACLLSDQWSYHNIIGTHSKNMSTLAILSILTYETPVKTLLDRWTSPGWPLQWGNTTRKTRRGDMIESRTKNAMNSSRF